MCRGGKEPWLEPLTALTEQWPPQKAPSPALGRPSPLQCGRVVISVSLTQGLIYEHLINTNYVPSTKISKI